MLSNSHPKAFVSHGSAGNKLCDSESTKRWPRERSSSGSCSNGASSAMKSPRVLSASPPASTAGAQLRRLALS